MARRKKPLVNRLASLALFIAITFVVFNFTNIIKQSMIFFGFADLNWEQIQEIELETDAVLDSRAEIMHFNDNILVYFKSKISIYNSDGDSLGVSEIQSVKNAVIGLKDYVVVIDKIQGNITVIDYNGVVVNTIGPIGAIKDAVSASDNTFVVLTENNYFSVYNYNGVVSFDYDLPKGELLGLEISKDKEYLLLTLLISSESKYNSRLLTYDINQKTLVGGSDNVNTVVFGSKISQDEIIIVDLVGQHAYPKGDPENILWEAVREGELINFQIDDNGNIYELTEIKEVQEITGQSEYHLVCRNKDGKLIFDITLEYEFKNSDIFEGKILLQSDKSLLVYNSAGELVSQKKSNKKIYSASWINASRLVVEYTDYLEILELTY